MRLLAEDLLFGTMADFGKRDEMAVAMSGVGVADGKLVVVGSGWEDGAGALRGCPPLEGVAEDRRTLASARAAGWSEGKTFPS